MLKLPVLHPEILSSLASAGHLSRVLISDGNYPHNHAPNPRAKIVWANFCPGMVDAVTLLGLVAELVPIELVHVMQPAREGAWAMQEDPPIWQLFRKVLDARSNFRDQFIQLQKPEFNDLARGDATTLVIASAEIAIYANILITIGVVR